MLTIESQSGLWRRSLIAFQSGDRDASTWVRWLQGPQLFVDLRVPQGRPRFEGVRCLRELQEPHLAWLSKQHGFAGRFVRCDGYFEWQRLIDFQPPTGVLDRGKLRWNASVLIETALDDAYVEHWHRDAVAMPPVCGMQLVDPIDARVAVVVRVGTTFMFARSRSAEVTPQSSSAMAAQDRVDCEISFGELQGERWPIQRSTLPFKEGLALGFSRDPSKSRVTTDDISPDGESFSRSWEITQSEGDWT